MIWDTSSGACLHTLGGHGNVSSIAFSHDSMQLASASRDGTIEIWDASSCVCLHRSEIYNNDFIVKAFSHDLMHLALVSNSTSVIKVWDASSGTCLQTLNSDCKYVFSIAFSQNFAWLASALRSNTVKIWDISSVAFSHNSMRLASASASDDRVIKIWDTSNGACLQTYKGHSRAIKSVAFSYNSMQIASASRDKTIKIWDTSGSACLWKHEDHKDNVSSMTFLQDPMQHILDTTHCRCVRFDFVDSRTKRYASHPLVTLHSLTWTARGLSNNTIEIQDKKSNACLKTLKGHRDSIQELVLSHDSTRLASTSKDNTVKIWDISSGTCLQTLEHDDSDISEVFLFNNSTLLVSTLVDSTTSIWDTKSGTRLQILKTCSLFFLPRILDLLYPEGTLTQKTTHCSINIAADHTWITRHDEEWLWLPAEHRPGHFVI